MKVYSEELINVHYDCCVDRANALALNPDHVIDLINAERDKCLEMLKRDGVVRINKRGQLWEVIG